jgi:hypothetical protein
MSTFGSFAPALRGFQRVAIEGRHSGAGSDFVDLSRMIELEIPLVRGKDRRRSGLVSDIVDPDAIDFELPPSLAGLSPCTSIWQEFGRDTGKESTLAPS